MAKLSQKARCVEINLGKDNIYETLEHELHCQEKQLEELQQRPANYPDGYLFIRETSKHRLFYRIVCSGEKNIQTNISDQPKLIKQLAEKKVHKKLLRTYTHNIKTIRQFLGKYKPLNAKSLFPANLLQVLTEPLQSNCSYERCPFDPKLHIHETICGVMVRSKSESIIANALWHYGIPFNYEEIFFTGDGGYFYPDFTIHLPDGSVIIWEHLGLLSKKTYCRTTAEKLYHFQNAHITIGKNLILTQDDWKGACDSAQIYYIIENYILPHFKVI